MFQTKLQWWQIIYDKKDNPPYHSIAIDNQRSPEYDMTEDNIYLEVIVIILYNYYIYELSQWRSAVNFRLSLYISVLT